MCGLNSADTTPNYADIDFAIRLKSTGWIAVYENGVVQADNIGTYIAGDVFRVNVTAGVVTYRKNGTTFFTSAAVPTFPLAVNTSFLTTGGTINAVTLVSHTGWTFAGDLAAARSSHRSDVLADGRVLVTGGSNDSPPLGTAELFDPATGVWTGTHPMVTPRVDHSTSLLDDGRLLAAGGYDPIGAPLGQPTNTSELYDPVTDQWIATSPMVGQRAHFGLDDAHRRTRARVGRAQRYRHRAIRRVIRPRDGSMDRDRIDGRSPGRAHVNAARRREDPRGGRF